MKHRFSEVIKMGSLAGIRKMRGLSLALSIIIIVFTVLVLPTKLEGSNSFIKNMPDLKTSKNEVMVTPSNKIWNISDKPEIYPAPVHVEYSDIYHPLFTRKGGPALYLIASDNMGKRAAAVFNRQLERIGQTPVPVVSGLRELPSSCKLAIVFKVDSLMDETHGGQAYALKHSAKYNKHIIEASGTGEQGCIYAATALGQLITFRDAKAVLREAAIKDFPVYKRRIFNYNPTEVQAPDILDWMVRYRMECLNLTSTPWWEVSNNLKETLVGVDQWKKKFGGVHIMLALHIYQKKNIVISNPVDRDALKKVIEAGLEKGVDRVMIRADDSPPFKNGEGYVLTSKEDKARFANMAEAHCFLMQDLKDWLDKRGAKCELYYCPPFYTYQDNNLGDMEMHKGTPWEEEAFVPLKRDLDIIGRDMPADVFIIWTGPEVRSRKISDLDIQDWTKNLAGRAPFLWDNTMYGHHPFTNTALFTAYDNDLPANFHLKTAGNGMFINGAAYGESDRAAYMTANDFLWNGMRYLPQQSINSAVTTLYGEGAVKNILGFKDAELTLRQVIGERQFKSDVDILWNAVLKIRATTEKNPFYYMRIYTRLKALNYQLKYSVPDTIKSFQEQVVDLDHKRRVFLQSLEQAGLDNLVDVLKDEMVQIP
jgi:hypothetical protein